MENQVKENGEESLRVLVVDDQPMVGEAVRRMIADVEHVEYMYCQYPDKAIPMALEFKPTVILQDLVMPDVDGLTLAKFIRSHPELGNVPLIVLSSKEEAVTKADAFAVGANDYLVKLPDPIELIARIRYHSMAYINLQQRNEAYAALKKSQEELADQLTHAAEYVVSLLPEKIVEGPIRTDWEYHPSSQLGGDSFGYHWVDDTHFAVYLLDVCDHGVGPALLSVSVLNVLKTESLPGVDFLDPSQTLAVLNDVFQMERHNDLYFTMWYGVLDVPSDTIRYASAGHPPALLMSEGGEIEDLKTPNMIVGGMPDLEYTSNEISLKRPSTLFVFSDGVYEVPRSDGSMWSLDGLKSFLADDASRDAPMKKLYVHVMEMCGHDVLDDDFSMLGVNLL